MTVFTSLSAGFQFALSALSPPAAWLPADALRLEQTSPLPLHQHSLLSRGEPQMAAGDLQEARVCGSLVAVHGLFPVKHKRADVVFSLM